MDVNRQVMLNGYGRDADAWGPFANEVVDVGEAVVARGGEVADELIRGKVALRERFGADGPDGSDPGEAGAGAPFVRQVEPLAGADGLFDLLAGFEGEERGIADEQSGVRVPEHGDGIGGRGDEAGLGVEEVAEEDLGVGARAAGGVVGGYSSDGFESVWMFDDELNGAHAIERSDGAAGDDGELGGERGDGDEAEVGATGEELVGAERGERVVELVVFGEGGGQRRMLEVPHEGSRVEEADGCYANGME